MSYLARRSGAALAASAVLMFATCASATTIISHSGSTDPATESPAWTLSVAGTGTAGSGVTHLGEPAWKMTDPAGGSNGARWAYFPTTEWGAVGGWSVKWRMAGGNLKDSTGDDEAVMQINDGQYGFTFTLKVNGTGAGDGATLRQRLGGGADLVTNIPTIASRATGFHDFELKYNPSGGGVYSLFYDSNFVTDSNATSALKGTNTTTLSRIRWGGMDGNGNDDRDVDSYWSSVSFETVPEPGSFIMIGIGSIGLAVCGRRCWKKGSK